MKAKVKEVKQDSGTNIQQRNLHCKPANLSPALITHRSECQHSDSTGRSLQFYDEIRRNRHLTLMLLLVLLYKYLRIAHRHLIPHRDAMNVNNSYCGEYK